MAFSCSFAILIVSFFCLETLSPAEAGSRNVCDRGEAMGAENGVNVTLALFLQR